MKSIRKLLREGLLNESMDVYIKDFNYGDHFNTLSDIKYHIQKKVTTYLIELIGEQKFDEYREYGFFEYDGGSSPYDPTGVINFYTWNMPPELVKHTCKFIFDLMKEKDIILKITGPEDSGSVKSQVMRLDVIHNVVDMNNTPPELNLSNTNARYFFTEILRYSKNEFENMSFPVDDVLTRIEFALNNLDLTDYDSAPKMKKVGNMTMHSQGYDVEDVKYRLEMIKNICDFAKAKGYRTIVCA